jgi:hypothetical protein
MLFSSIPTFFIKPFSLLTRNELFSFLIATPCCTLPLTDLTNLVSNGFNRVIILFNPTPVFYETLMVSNSNYTSSLPGLGSVKDNGLVSLQEQTTEQRYLRSMNPIFKYDFKVGNYIPDDVKKMNPHLFNTIKDVTTGIRKSS